MKKKYLIFLLLGMIFLCMGCSDSEQASNAAHSGGEKAEEQVAFVKRIPMNEKLTQEASEKGTTETLQYTTHSYALEAVTDREEVMVDKEIIVYLPYNYDSSKSYNIVYMLHGTSDNEKYWLGDSSTGNVTKNMIDTMIESKKCEPTIFVSTCYYSFDKDMQFDDLSTEPYADEWPMYYWEELRNDIVPLVEKNYSTYAQGDVSEEGLTNSREHRAFVGLSRGSMTSVNSVMMECLDWFSSFGSYSGVWADFDQFKEKLNSDEYKDFSIDAWYNGNGSADFSLENHEAFKEKVLTEMPERFKMDENYYWVNFPGGSHAFNCWLPDLYNSMLVFFQE